MPQVRITFRDCEKAAKKMCDMYPSYIVLVEADKGSRLYGYLHKLKFKFLGRSIVLKHISPTTLSQMLSTLQEVVNLTSQKFGESV